MLGTYPILFGEGGLMNKVEQKNARSFMGQ
jgi:hypothetical protein